MPFLTFTTKKKNAFKMFKKTQVDVSTSIYEFQSHGIFQDYIVLPFTLLKIKVLYWHQWFHKEPLPSMEPFNSTKGSLQWRKGSLDY